ncbi:MAG: hypothetical protein JWQ78_1560 [Sediminibacterium sp.]|nr:hypothetical protein [Sediminibacterium sp.]
MTLIAVTELIGHFHPVLVHLPIGILLLAVLMQWLSVKDNYSQLGPAVPVAYLAGCIGAVLACVSGWLLASGGEYDESTLDLHRWMGISVAAVSGLGYYFAAKQNTRFLQWAAVLLFALIMITGHLGGTLTHGEGYLTQGFSNTGADSAIAKKNISNAQEAVLFTDLIQPVFQEKCGGCHGAKKQKGGLRLDGSEWILKGGKDGTVVMGGNPEASDLYKRVIMDPLEEKHMPPKGKPQLTEQERMLLHWWIATGLSFTKKTKELEQPAPIKAVLLAIEKSGHEIPVAASVPAAPVAKAPESVLNELRKAGVTILPVAVNSNYLTANFVNAPRIDKRMDSLLGLVKQQLTWIKMPGAEWSDESWRALAGFPNITRLSIEHSNISDGLLGELKALSRLQYLNLVDTRVTLNGLMPLKQLTQLSSLYLAQTKITAREWPVLQKNFPKVRLDSGGYQVASLATDTVLLKAKGKR